MNQSVTRMINYCIDKIQCDLHYEKDWNYRLRKDFTCDETESLDICFATNACVCDNGYFKIAADMPSLPADYTGPVDADVLAAFKEQITDNITQPDVATTQRETTNSSDSNDDWILVVIICGCLIGLIAIGTSIYYGVQFYKKKQLRA